MRTIAILIIVLFAMIATAKAQQVVNIKPGEKVTIITSPCDGGQVQQTKTIPTAKPIFRRYAPASTPSKLTVDEIIRLGNFFNQNNQAVLNAAEKIVMLQNRPPMILKEDGTVITTSESQYYYPSAIDSTKTDNSLPWIIAVVLFIVLLAGAVYFLLQQQRNHYQNQNLETIYSNVKQSGGWVTHRANGDVDVMIDSPKPSK